MFKDSECRDEAMALGELWMPIRYEDGDAVCQRTGKVIRL